MKLTEVELRVIELPLVRPFRTSFGTQSDATIPVNQLKAE